MRHSGKLLNLGCAIILMLVATTSLRAAEPERNGLGVGVILGEPTGFSLKKWTGSTTAIDGGVAWSFSKGSSFHIHADYLWHAFDAIPGNVNLPVYYGIGGRLKATSTDNSGNTGTRLGIRGVVGIDFIPERAPIDVFVEIAPVMDFVPSTDLGFNGGVGIRVWLR